MSTKQTSIAGGTRLPFELSLRNIMIVLLLVAIGISGYLSYVKFVDTYINCAEGETINCKAVIIDSPQSQFLGISIAYIGLAANLVLLGMLLLEDRIAFLQEYGVTLVFCILLFAFAYSMYLIYVQAAEIGKYCMWCLAHEAVITLLFIAAGLRVREFFAGTDEE